MVNKVFLIGRLGKDPELKTTKNNITYCFLSLAITSRMKDGNEYKEVTKWISVKLYRKAAENAVSFLKKGRLVYVEGHINTGDFVDDAGKKIYTTEIVGNIVNYLGGNNEEKKENKSSPDFTPDKYPTDSFSNDDIPF